MKDPHLDSVRRAHRLRVGGHSWQDIAGTLGVSQATARNRVAEYHRRRSDGTLFSDLDATMNEDIWNHPSIMPRRAVNSDKLK